MEPTISITGDGNAVGNSNTISVNKTSVTSGALVADFAALLGQLRGALDAAELDPKTRRIVQADLDVVEGEVADEKPSGSIILAKLKSIADVAKNATAIGTAGAAVWPHLHQAIQMAQGLFK